MHETRPNGRLASRADRGSARSGYRIGPRIPRTMVGGCRERNAARPVNIVRMRRTRFASRKMMCAGETESAVIEMMGRGGSGRKAGIVLKPVQAKLKARRSMVIRAVRELSADKPE